MVKPCTECELEFQPQKCGQCNDFMLWFPEAWNNACAWLRRELEWREQRRREKAAIQASLELKPSSDGTYSYRDIVFGTIFTELWR